MTEEEAKTKWCPFARVPMPNMGSDEGIPVGNRYESGDGGEWNHCLCIGSACMAWRDTTYTETILTEPTTASTGVRHEKRPGGYCGLAGKP